MAGLLDFVAGFGVGALGGLAEQKKANLEQKRQLNLAKLKAEYAAEIQAKQEERKIKQRSDLLDLYRRDPAAAQEEAFVADVELPTNESQTDAMRNLDDKIARLMASNPGMSRKRATNIALGIESLRTDPITGASSVYTPTPNGYQAIPVPPQPETANVSVDIPPEVDPEELAFDPGEAVGMFAVGKNIWNKTVGQFSFAPTFLGPERAAQNITIMERDLINALASSGKPPVIEQERIMSLLPNPNVFLSNPTVANEKVAQVVDLLGIQRRDDLRTLTDPNLNSKLKQELQSRVNRIESIVNRVLKPEAAENFLSYGVSVDGNVTLDPEKELETYKQLFKAEITQGQTPEVPYSLVKGYFEGPDEFMGRIKTLGFEPGQSFRYQGRVYQVPRG